MLFDKLTRLLGNALHPKPDFITVTPVTGNAPAPALPPHEALPRHVAIIMDGNGRWATSRGLPRSQTAQTAALIADNTAQTQYIVNRVAPYPIPAYTVANPVTPAA